jgi:hypothetical protein
MTKFGIDAHGASFSSAAASAIRLRIGTADDAAGASLKHSIADESAMGALIKSPQVDIRNKPSRCAAQNRTSAVSVCMLASFIA